MVSQRIASYNEREVYTIAEKIAKDAERYKIPVKTVSLTSHVHGYSTFYSAIAIFEEVKENERFNQQRSIN